MNVQNPTYGEVATSNRHFHTSNTVRSGPMGSEWVISHTAHLVLELSKINYKFINCEFASRVLINQSVPRTSPSQFTTSQLAPR